MHATLVGDLLVIRCRGVLTAQEERLRQSERGAQLVCSAREELFALSKGEVEGLVAVSVGCAVLRSHMSFDPEAGEQIEVYVLEHDVERRLLRRDLDRLSGLAKPTKS